MKFWIDADADADVDVLWVYLCLCVFEKIVAKNKISFSISKPAYHMSWIHECVCVSRAKPNEMSISGATLCVDALVSKTTLFAPQNELNDHIQ